MTTWHVVPGDNDTFDILKGGRAHTYGIDTPEEAVRRIRKSRYYSKGDRVVVDPYILAPGVLRRILSIT